MPVHVVRSHTDLSSSADTTLTPVQYLHPQGRSRESKREGFHGTGAIMV